MKRRGHRNKTGGFALGFHLLARAAILLLALIQIVAPMWHVCVLGGSAPHHAEYAKPIEWKPKCGGGPKCVCTPPKPVASPDVTLGPAPSSDCFDGTCLARLLMGMPGGVATPATFGLLAQPRATFAPTLFVAPCVAILPQPPARGPPRSSACS